MRLLAISAVVLALAGVASAPAGAQQIIVGFGGDQPALQTTIPVRASGQLTVQFHGDDAAGCARWGLCGYSGSVSWRPGPGASLVIDRTLGPHARTSVTYLPSFLAGPALPGGVTSADVALQPGGAHCVDAATTGQFLGLPVRAGRLTFSLAGAAPALLVTRCAGPRDGDVIPALPAPSVSVNRLSRGKQMISLATSRALNAHGFTGTITSTVVLRLGAPGRTTRSGRTSPPSRGTRVREIDVGYRATVSGSVVEQVRGAANPLLCAPLASCGLIGTVTLTPHGSGHAALTAQQLASKPPRTLLAAVGLGSGSARGIGAFGVVQWRASRAGVTVDLTQAGERCHDATTLGSGGLIMAAGEGRLGVSYVPAALAGEPNAIHCPGPLPGNATAAAGRVPLSMLRRRTTRIRLTIGSRMDDDGYLVRFVPDMTLTLTRVSRHTRIVTLPPGVSPG